MRRIFILALILSLPILSIERLEGASDAPKRGGTLTLAITRDLELMNPLVRTRSTEQSIRDLMFDSLLGTDLEGNIRPNLAESWETSRDGRVYTFRLRRGVKFHNGQEMTAEDVKFSMDFSRNPKNAAYGLVKLELIDRVEAPDKYTVRVYFKEPSLPFLSSITDIQAFSVIPKGSLKEGVDKPTRFPPGTGPFKFVEWKPTQQIVLERHEEYWGPKPFLDRVILRPIRDNTVRFTALRAGDVDIVERTPYEWVKQVVDGKIKGMSYVQAPHAGYRQLVFNVAAPPFNNKSLRLAVAHAIDRKEILQAAFLGFGDPADQLYPKGHTWYFDGVSAPAHDLNRASALLKESGYKGETIEIQVQQGEEPEPTALQAQLRRIGMNIQLKVVEAGAVHAMHRRGDFNFYFGGGNFAADPHPTYGTEFICEADLKKRNNNASGYCDKEMDALITAAEKELDSAKRRALMRQIVTRVSQDIPELPLFFVPRFFTFRDHVKGFTTDGDGAFRWWGGGVSHTWLDK
jgi:ABC-type transport system substrate-binding protein